MDLHDLSKLDKKFDLVLLMHVPEHTANPFVVASELTRIISNNGYLFVASPFFYPLHNDPTGRFGDYWRFSNDGLRILFKGLREVWIKNVPSVILSVRDRRHYWDNDKTVSGYCTLCGKG